MKYILESQLRHSGLMHSKEYAKTQVTAVPNLEAAAKSLVDAAVRAHNLFSQKLSPNEKLNRSKDVADKLNSVYSLNDANEVFRKAGLSTKDVDIMIKNINSSRIADVVTNRINQYSIQKTGLSFNELMRQADKGGAYFNGAGMTKQQYKAQNRKIYDQASNKKGSPKGPEYRLSR